MKTALIVDDTKNIRLLLSHCLRNENFDVYTATNATEALDLVRNINFDIAFIDIKMPNISGTALLEEIVKEGYIFPVVIMTAFGTIKNAVTTTKLGARAYLQKPFTSNTIKKVLSEVLTDYTSEITGNIDNKQINPLPNISLLLANNPTNPSTYDEVGDILINSGQIEKGNLFKEFSLKLKNIK